MYATESTLNTDRHMTDSYTPSLEHIHVIHTVYTLWLQCVTPWIHDGFSLKNWLMYHTLVWYRVMCEKIGMSSVGRPRSLPAEMKSILSIFVVKKFEYLCLIGGQNKFLFNLALKISFFSTGLFRHSLWRSGLIFVAMYHSVIFSFDCEFVT